jgi:hypothetical protein
MFCSLLPRPPIGTPACIVGSAGHQATRGRRAAMPQVRWSFYMARLPGAGQAGYPQVAIRQAARRLPGRRMRPGSRWLRCRSERRRAHGAGPHGRRRPRGAPRETGVGGAGIGRGYPAEAGRSLDSSSPRGVANTGSRAAQRSSRGPGGEARALRRSGRRPGGAPIDDRPKGRHDPSTSQPSDSPSRPRSARHERTQGGHHSCSYLDDSPPRSA